MFFRKKETLGLDKFCESAASMISVGAVQHKGEIRSLYSQESEVAAALDESRLLASLSALSIALGAKGLLSVKSNPFATTSTIPLITEITLAKLSSLWPIDDQHKLIQVASEAFSRSLAGALNSMLELAGKTPKDIYSFEMALYKSDWIYFITADQLYNYSTPEDHHNKLYSASPSMDTREQVAFSIKRRDNLYLEYFKSVARTYAIA